uniref:WGS project CBMI000000000 data, contig CS3069_c003789 n=1 Tax=Fusarium clavum TaxID=2594811 RepID=A0A090MK39_9HYPO|nr:unnamed protein product [Fusarium clavum]
MEGLAPFPFSPPQPATSGAGYCSRNYHGAPSITIRLRRKLAECGNVFVVDEGLMEFKQL